METSRVQVQLKMVRWLPWGLALACLAYLSGLVLWLALSGLLFPYQLDYGEGLVLHFVNEWAHGRPIYGAIGVYPYITANYPPLAIILALALTPILGIGYAAGRVWTLLAVLAAAGLILVWVRRAGGRWLPAIAAALAFAGSPYIYHWAPLFRVDLIGLALTLGGLYAIYALTLPKAETDGTSHPKRWLIWVAVVLFVAGLYAKQSFFFAPAAAAIYLFFVDRREALKLVGGMLVLGGGLFLLINALSQGGFWQGLVTSNVNPFLWPEFGQQLADFFGTFAILSLLAIWYAVEKFVIDRSAPLRDKVSPLDLYLLASLFSLLLAGKAGAWENYFFEALAAIVLCAGLGLARFQRYGKWTFHLLTPVLLLAQVTLMWHTPRIANRYMQLTRDSNEAIQPILAFTPDPMFSEDMGLLVTNDKVLDYCSFQYSQLARAGRWDQSWELGQLRERQLSAVILEEGTRFDVDRYQRFTREFLSELNRNYRHAQTLGKYELYEPDPLQHECHVEFGGELALIGWSVHAPLDLEPGDTFSLTIVWQAQGAVATDYTSFAHLVDEKGQGLSGVDQAPHGGLYPTTAWGPDEMVRDTFEMMVPGDAPPGLYDIQVGWYDPATKTRLPAGAEDSVRIAVLPVAWSESNAEAMIPSAMCFGEAITLEGYDWEIGSETLEVVLRWSADDYLDTDYTVFVHLVAGDGKGPALAQGDGSPMDGRWPTSMWLPGVPLDDEHIVPLPPDLGPGAYHLLVGLYDPATGIRLPLADGTDALQLVEVELP